MSNPTEPPDVEDREIAEKTARDLQWDELLERIGHYASSDAAREVLAAYRPLGTREAAEAAHARTREALALLARGAALPVRVLNDVGHLCLTLGRDGQGNAKQLRDAANVIEHALRLRRHTQEHAALCPELERYLWCDPALGALRERIDQAIDEAGELRDSASPGLRSARRALAAAREKIRSESQRLLGKYKDSLAGQFVAERNGRAVLAVRVDAPERVPGSILGSSGSGNSLYVEPTELAELNNRLYISEAAVLREEAKVLLELSSAARELVDALERAADNCVRADVVAAVARWADTARALPVSFVSEPHLILLQMRHPLLIREGARVVSNDLRLRAGQCLVVSGPNAGGKTVALKCLGLAVWLAQSGLPVPCLSGSELGWFSRVLTDIGDEQSISRSLSTFSAHVTRLGRHLAQADGETLVLLDEVAGGTDPEEGAALAAALLEGFLARGALVATTTHYERLKRLGAAEDSAFVNASVGFDTSTMQPTFALHLGTPGQSSALAVAERYGIPTPIVERARELLPQEQVRQQQLLELLERERMELSRMRASTEEELTTQRDLSRRLEYETERAREHERKRLSQEAKALTLEVLEARALIRRAKEALQGRQPEREQVRAAEALLATGAKPVTLEGTLSRALEAHDPDPPLQAEALTVGLRVRIPHLNATGEVLALPQKGLVRVNIGGMKLAVPIDKLRPARAPKPVPSGSTPQRALGGHRAPRGGGGRSPAGSATPSTGAGYIPSRTSDNTCDLRGMRVEQGLDQIDGFIDRMLRDNEPVAYFLHGHGTGAMKDAVREYVDTSPHVARWEAASPEDGGDALTLCWL